MENQKKKQIIPPKLLALVVIVILICGIVAVFAVTKKDQPKPEVITISTLERIINVSELSTFTAVYNGIADVKNEKKPEETDYYVAYEAYVDAGIDFEKIKFSVDNEKKSIFVDIPEIHITDTTVDIASLDFIFLNEKANTSTITQEAYKACEEDVANESERQSAIYDLAKQNAVNVLTALINPIIEQLDTEYTLTID